MHVVTNVVNLRAFSLIMAVFGLGLTTFVTLAAHWSPGQAPLPPINFACNSPADPSNYEFTTLGLQRFQPLLKPLPIELHATFGEARDPPPPTVTAARPCRPDGPLV